MDGCLIYDKRPKICRDFPQTPRDLRHFKKCGFTFDAEQVRSGSCNGCQECCINMPWSDDTDINTLAPAIEINRDETTKRMVKDLKCRFRGLV